MKNELSILERVEREGSKLDRKLMSYNLRHIIILAVSLFFFAILVGPAFSLSLPTGIGFVLATCLAIYRRDVIFKQPMLISLIYVGVVFGYAVTTTLWPAIVDELLHGSIVSGLIILGLFLYLQWKAKQIKSGEI